MSTGKHQFIIASTPAHYSDARMLFEEYAAILNVDLCFQDFERELSELPAIYGPPHGRLLLLEAKGELAGCVAVKFLTTGVCEMKRLYL